MELIYSTWLENVRDGLSSVEDQRLAQLARLLYGSDLVLTAGNGGSSCLASHLSQALMKPAYKAGGGKSAVCLTDTVSTLSAHANDGGWGSALVELARPFIESRRCTLVLISSSGNSENICLLAKLGLSFGCPVVGFTGFSGGELRKIATLSIHVDSHDYEVVEPVHDALIHRVQYHLRTISDGQSNR